MPTDVTSGIVVSNSAAGATVSYQPTAPMPGGANTLQAVYSDGLVSTTNTWQFTVISLPVLTAYLRTAGRLLEPARLHAAGGQGR